MSVATFGAATDEPRKGRAIFAERGNSVKSTIYGGDDDYVPAEMTATGRKHLAPPPGDTPFAMGAHEIPAPARSTGTPYSKNSKFDVGAAKVGAGGFDYEQNQTNYEMAQMQAANMKARNQGGYGIFNSE